LFGSRADISPLGIQYDRNIRMALVNIANQLSKLTFCCSGSKIGKLRLESTHRIRRGVDNVAAESEHCVTFAVSIAEICCRQTLWIGVQTDAQHRLPAMPALDQLFVE